MTCLYDEFLLDYKIKNTIYSIKKAPQNVKLSYYFEKTKNYFAFLAYLLLNLSIRPAVSISLDLPV